MFAIFFAVLVFVFSSFSHAQVVNKTQLVKANHWVYDAMATLESETKHPIFTETAPLTVGELEFYFKGIERDKLSEYAKMLYDDVNVFLHSKPIGFFRKEFGFAANPQISLELYHKTNPQIDWSFNYFYKDNLLSVPIKVAVSQYFTGELEVFLGKNWDASNKPWAFCNIPLNLTDMEFSQPTWAYGVTGITCKKWGINFVAAREGFRIGRTLFGSVIYNDTFETQGFFQLNIFSEYFKYNLDMVQVNTNKFLYLHQFEAKLFKRLKFVAIEGSLIYGPFEFKNLNPFMIMHSFGLWGENWNDDEWSAQYLAFLVEFCPAKNWKLYALMAQNEITSPREKDNARPNSFGFQVGLNSCFPKRTGQWVWNFEGIWTMPYLYIKQNERNTFYSNRYEMHGESSTIKSWIGTPLGPDCMGCAFEFGYEARQKWCAKIGYSFVAHGENGFALLEEALDKNNKQHYYPTNQVDKEAALSDAKKLTPHGIIEFTHRAAISGSYHLNKYAQFNAQLMFVCVTNCGNKKGNGQTGLEMALSVKCEPL